MCPEVPRPRLQAGPHHHRRPLGEVGAAVEARDKARFETAFDKLTAACNQCHQAANFGFNVVKRPTAPPFTNQEFGVVKPPA